MNLFCQENFVNFTFTLENGKSLRLSYVLQPNSLREKWLKEVKSQQKVGGSYLNLKISNKNYLHLNELTKKLNSIIEELNSAYEEDVLVSLSGVDNINRETLNELHEQFEEYGENMDFLYRGESIHRRWLDLNEWIHVTETAMSTQEEDFPNYSALVSVYPPYPGKMLEEKDKLFLSTDFSWGQLYLGYNTLGKDYMHSCQDNDVRVIINDQIKVQELYGSEVWLCFQQKSHYLNQIQMDFYNWYKNLKEDVRRKIPIKNLNDLALGRYYLGRIVITEDLLNFHSVKEDWYSNENLQKRWNNEVFSQIKSIKKIDFYP